jgi:hypothetical protein
MVPRRVDEGRGVHLSFSIFLFLPENNNNNSAKPRKAQSSGRTMVGD